MSILVILSVVQGEHEDGDVDVWFDVFPEDLIPPVVDDINEIDEIEHIDVTFYVYEGIGFVMVDLKRWNHDNIPDYKRPRVNGNFIEHCTQSKCQRIGVCRFPEWHCNLGESDGSNSDS
jgi:hypothetical protein